MILAVIKVDLSVQSIEDAIQKLDDLSKALDDLSRPVSHLCLLAKAQTARVAYSALSSFPGPRTAFIYQNHSGNHGEVVMEGPGVSFLEFGAGVHFNGTGSYPIKTPPGIVGIGEYGMGQGKQDMWKYGNKWTHGNPSAKPLYFGALAAEQNAPVEFKVVIDSAI
jgi:hypothetical protein